MAAKNTLEFTDQDFDKDVLDSPVPVLVDFWGEGCQPCKALSPVIDSLADDYQGKARIGKLKLDDNPKSSVRFSISSIPTVILFHSGEVVAKFSGLRGKKDFVVAIDRLLALK